MTGIHRVIVKDDDGKYVLSTRRVYRDEQAAQAYADCLPSGREPIVFVDDRRDENDYLSTLTPPKVN